MTCPLKTGPGFKSRLSQNALYKLAKTFSGCIDKITFAFGYRLNCNGNALFLSQRINKPEQSHQLWPGFIPWKSFRYIFGHGTAEHNHLYTQLGCSAQCFREIIFNFRVIDIIAGQPNARRKDIVACFTFINGLIIGPTLCRFNKTLIYGPRLSPG